ncbi:probable helicase senataxin [Varanus komodoensis]|uniref:probable helicase senataxin n=1 Tax=Varanus komodoensis TaxID=61221 RepID=UPI001CF77FB8|nr:probable helicase senataxin [Varanus komodoensis]
MEQINFSYQVIGKHPGIYLLMVHPNEVIRRWALLTARNLGKVDRDDYYDIQEVLTCLFKVIELGLFENPDIYNSSVFEKGKLILLPSHLYDTTNHKNYWLGICMLLTVLEEQAMETLLLGPDKQNDFMQSIMNTMKKEADDGRDDPFWPALHCFMVVLDKLGSKVWGQLIDPIQAFQTIINNTSYIKEIEHIRQSCRRTKSEPPSDYGDEMITCSQIVYNYHPEKPHKDIGWRTAVCPDYCPNLYEDMQTLSDMFQSEIGRDMQLHNSTFLWFIPFVHSLMDLTNIGVAYGVEIIRHLCSEVRVVPSDALQGGDKVSEFFIWILVTVVELSIKRNCFQSLWICSEKWVETVVKCATLPSTVFACAAERGGTRSCPRSASAISSWEHGSVQSACMNLIRNILKEGYQVGQKATPFLDELNLLRRSHKDWNLSPERALELQTCLKQIIWQRKLNPVPHVESPTACVSPPSLSVKLEWQEDRCLADADYRHGPYLSPRGRDDVCLEGSSPRKNPGLGKEQCARSPKDQPLHRTSECLLSNVKQEPKESLVQESNNLRFMFAKGHRDAQKNGRVFQGLGDQSESDATSKSCFEQAFQNMEKKEVIPKEEKASCLAENNHSDRNGHSASKTKVGLNNLVNKNESKKPDLTLKLKQLFGNQKSKKPASGPDTDKPLPANSGSSGWERPRGEVAAPSCGTSNVSLCKLETSSSDAFQGKPLCIKRESKDTLADFRNTLKAARDSDGSSTDDETANVPLTEIRQQLMKKTSLRTGSPLTDSQVDRDLGKMSLAAYAKASDFPVLSQENTVDCQDHIQRKVQGAIRSWSDCESKRSVSDADSPLDQVVIISDTSSDEDENKVNDGRKNKKENMPACLEKPSGAQGQERATTSNYPALYDECESQCFEFETDEEIFSVWQDSQMEEETEDKGLAVKPSSCLISHDLEVARQLNDWGYDTDYLKEDIIEKAADELEQQVKGSRNEAKASSARSSKGHASRGSETVCPKHVAKKRADGAVGPTASRSAGSSAPKPAGENLRLGKSAVKSQQAKTANKQAEKRSAKPNAHNKKLPTPTPFIVPPRKVHHFPEPTSAVEKLGLKKKPRKAAEMSQRTQDSLAELRNYGKTAGKLSPQKRKTKLIQPPNMIVRNKKLLASQERQFYKQSRERVQGSSGGSPRTQSRKTAKKADAKGCEPPANIVGVKNQKERAACFRRSSGEKSLLRQSSLEREGAQPAPGSPVKKAAVSTKEEPTLSHAKGQESPAPVPGSLFHPLTGNHRTDTSVFLGSSSKLCHESTTLKESEAMVVEDIFGEDDGLFLTQRDPVDMELSSQMDDEDMEAIIVQSPLEDHSFSGEKLKHAGCTEQVNKAGVCLGNHPAPDPPDHMFAKPLAPPRPSTTKIFSSSSSSRSANLTKDLDHVQKPAWRSRSNPGSSNGSDGLKLKTPTFSSIFQPQSLNNFLSHRHNNHAVERGRMLTAISFKQDANPAFSQANIASVRPKNDDTFIEEILKWTYNMFIDLGQLGAPNHLLTPIVASVPVKFQNYDDHFNTFFPLMMLNAFEEVASDWQENQKAKEAKPFFLNLQDFNAQVQTAEFRVTILESDLDKQLYPKEYDLVFLRVSEKRREGESRSNLVYHVGLVIRFSRVPEDKKQQHVACHLSIKTRGNLSRVDQQVQCVVVSSLASTKRRFRALLLLKRSPLINAILSPSYSNFCPSSMNMDCQKSASYMGEYNEDQWKAIETAYTMVTQHPSLPKICLIHGPPGTGKSKVIVGLVCRILGERSGKETPMQSWNAKNKQNRVLVCAPSNAAVDELMKKIILEFKGKCPDMKKALDKTAPGKDQDLQRRKADLDRQLDMLSRQRAMNRGEAEKKQQLDEKITRLSKERERLASQLKEIRHVSQEMQAKIILASHIICCTLSTSGIALLETTFRRQGSDPVSCVIVDEAGQSCEVETLIPLIHGCKKLVLVGDLKQLPPTVKSMKAQEYDYHQSLMGRLWRHQKEQLQEGQSGTPPVLQLTIQYRMHPEICLFPSKYIYDHALKTDRQTEVSRFSLDWPFQPYLLFDVLDGREERDNGSYVNPQEIKLVIELLKLIRERRSSIGRNIGIITPYSAQKRRIQKQLDAEFRENSFGEVDTVDGFQGREKDCVIVTCVRANSTQGSIGFLRSLQRLNVTITRAKHSLFILGKLKTLMENHDWNELIQDARKRGSIIPVPSHKYKSCALRILKARLLPRPGAAVPERATQGQTGMGRAEQSEASSRDPQRPPASAGAPSRGSCAPPPPSGPQEHSSRKLCAQATPPVETPRDPRLAQRAEAAMDLRACRDVRCSPSSSSGAVLPQGPGSPGAQRSWSNAMQEPASRTETPGHSAPRVHPPGIPSCARPHKAQEHDWRVPDKAETLGSGDPRSPTEWGQAQDYHPRLRRPSEFLENQSPLDIKRRRTNY